MTASINRGVAGVIRTMIGRCVGTGGAMLALDLHARTKHTDRKNAATRTVMNIKHLDRGQGANAPRQVKRSATAAVPR